MLKRNLAISTIGFSLLAATAIAQTSAPTPSAPAATTAPSATNAPVAAKEPAQNLAMPGKWRASKLMGVDIYGPDQKKIGDVTEVVFDKSGAIETVTVGVGGFLGIGAKDVAIPFGQITWSDQPMASAAPASAPAGGSSSTATAPAASAPKAPNMYPDHGTVTMTKEQLTSAPAVTFTGS
jgi:sporulation protein YlmC with PRC-barrel domain